MKPYFILITVMVLTSSCKSERKTEKNLTASDVAFIQSLGLLDSNETVELFETNAGARQAGNFVTNKRMASYWIEDGEKETHSAFFDSIRTLSLTDNSRSILHSSVLTVYLKNGKHFELFIDADSLRLENFYAQTGFLLTRPRR